MKTGVLLAAMVIIMVMFFGCDNDCKDDSDCLYVNDQVGWIETDVDDGHCECAD